MGGRMFSEVKYVMGRRCLLELFAVGLPIELRIMQLKWTKKAFD